MRLFIAIPVEPSIKKRMIELQDQIDTSSAKVRWSTMDQLHLTLKFLGDVSESDVDSIITIMERSVTGIKPFDLMIGGVGCFHSRNAVRTIWVGGTEKSGSLLLATKALESRLAEIGFKKEIRTFSVHFTIGRVKYDNTRGILRRNIEATHFENISQTVNSIVLYKSDLCPDGAKYTSVHNIKLES